jgi:hypothetical protein
MESNELALARDLKVLSLCPCASVVKWIPVIRNFSASVVIQLENS